MDRGRNAIEGIGEQTEGVVVEGPEFGQFHIFGSEGFDEGGEDSWIGFYGAPVGGHGWWWRGEEVEEVV